MIEDNDAAEPFAELRVRAEDWLGVKRENLTANELSPDSDTHRLIHELHVHQIELEMQNEQLQQAQSELEKGLTRYTDLYEFAPVGYLTLDRSGVIGKVNLTGARLLRLERMHWIGRRLSLLFAVEVRSAFDAFLTKAFETQSRTIHELTLTRQGAEPMDVELTANASADGNECLVVVADITRYKCAERANTEQRRQLEQTLQMAKGYALAKGAVNELDHILGGILGGLSMLELELDQAGERRQGVEHVQALAERGAVLTKQLQTFGTGDPGTG